MKKQFALVLTALLLAASLAGCGKDTGDGTADGTGSAAADNGALNNDGGALNNDGGTGDDAMNNGNTVNPDPDGDGVNEGTVTGSNAAGTAATRDGNTLGTTTTRAGTVRAPGAAVTNQRTLVRGATYEQMLRNAYVHDTDGDLRDHENAVTPGTAY